MSRLGSDGLKKERMAALITFQFGIVLLLSPIPIGHGLFTILRLAEMTPVDPLVEVGDTLVLNCTLTPSYNGSQNASDIYFDHSGRNYSFPYVETLSNITAQLRLPNVAINMDGLFRCSLLPRTFLGVYASQSVHVVRRPLQPVVDGCIIANWERMECSWSPSREDQVHHTQGSGSFNQTLFYRHLSGSEWMGCPQNISERCIWRASQFQMGATYCIQVNVTNILKHVIASNIMCVQAQEEIVKPDPPKDVTWSVEDEGHLVLRWNPPTSTYNYAKPLVYQLSVRNEWQEQANNFTVVGATSQRLPGVPNTVYSVQISVRPARPGFTSVNAVATFKTPATVPCKNPYTLTNAFSRVKDNQRIVLYWKPIDAKDSCGPDISYEIRARQSPGGATDSADIWRVVSSAGVESSTEVTLRGEEDEVAVLAKNGMGVATHLPHCVIRVPSSLSETNASSNYRLVVEGNNNSVMVHWFAVAPMANVTDFTLFWCQQLLFTRICKTSIQWQNLSAAEQKYNLTLSENYLHFQVGLAVNFLSGFTTGIVWADKLYAVTAKAEAPHRVEVVAPFLGSHGELEVTWVPAPCIVRCTYIQTFVIFYCLADQTNGCRGDIKSIRIAPWEGYSYRFSNLEQGSMYKIWMTSIARTGSSVPSDPVYATPMKSWVTPGAVAGIVVAALCVGIITIGGLYIILRCLNKYRKKYVNGLNIAIPPAHRVQLPSTSSEAPMLGKKFDYSRQESVRSVSSGDSGRYSLTLTPASPAALPLLSKLKDANENVDSFVPANFSILEGTKKAENDDEDSMHRCVLSYTIPKVDAAVRNNVANSVSTLPNGATKMADSRKASLVPNGGHSKYIFLEQIGQPKVCEVNLPYTESNVDYCASFSFPPLSTSGNAVDIGYTKIENLQPLSSFANRLPSTDVVNEDSQDSQDSDLLEFDTSQDEAQTEQADLAPTIDQLLATLNADSSLLSDLRGDKPATSYENNEPKLPLPPPEPRVGGDDAPFRGYAKIANTDFPDMSCGDVEWRTSEPIFPQQSTLSNWGYVDHSMFGVDSVA